MPSNRSSKPFVLPEREATTDLLPSEKGTSILLPGLSLAGSIIQGACAILVASSSLKLLVGFVGLATAFKFSTIHSDPIRIPLMALSAFLACLTLFVLWNGYKLRNLPAARWRRQPLTVRQKLGIVLSLMSAALSLVLILGELILHPPFLVRH